MRSTMVGVFLLGWSAGAWAAHPPPVLPPGLEAVQCDELESHDYDGDGMRDLICITRRGDEDPQRLTVVFSSAPAGAPPALDIALLHCPNCSGAMPNTFDVSASSAPPYFITVSETGGSNSLWTHEYVFKPEGKGFALDSEEHSIDDRNTGASGSLDTYYQEGRNNSFRRASPEDRSASNSAGFQDIYALPRKGSIRVDGKGGEPAWKRAHRLTVPRGYYSVFERGPLGSNEDLSYDLRALWDETSLYLLIEVTDDSVVLAPATKSGVAYDHLEFWTDSGRDPWVSGFVPRMEPDPEKTVQFGLIPRRGSKRAQAMRWYPDEQEQSQVEAAYVPTAKGYTVEARFPLTLFRVLDSVALDMDQRGLRKGFINLTVIVSDSDSPKAPLQESMLATSQLEHRGAPFELGLLHLMKLATPDGWKR